MSADPKRPFVDDAPRWLWAAMIVGAVGVLCMWIIALWPWPK